MPLVVMLEETRNAKRETRNANDAKTVMLLLRKIGEQEHTDVITFRVSRLRFSPPLAGPGGLVLDLLRWLLGVPALAFLLYAPGAVVLNSVSARGHGRAFFAGVDEWLFSAVLISFLTTGLVAFILAEVGLFHWWLILGLVALVSLLVGMGLGGARPRLSSLLPLLAVPPAYPRRAVEGRLSRYQSWSLIALILAAGVLFSRPAEMLRGALELGRIRKRGRCPGAQRLYHPARPPVARA